MNIKESLKKFWDKLGIDIKEEPSLAVLSSGKELEELKACQSRVDNIEEMFKKVYYSSNKVVVQKAQVKNPIIAQRENEKVINEQAKGRDRDEQNKIKQKVILNYFLFQLDKSTGTHYNIKRSKYGEVAQLARAPGSYPVGHVFESHLRYQFL